MSRSEALIRVDCDFCGKVTEELTLEQPIADHPDIWLLEGGEESRLANLGWGSSAIGDICPTCTRAIEADKEHRRAL